MAKNSVFCIARDEVKAVRILDDLKASGFPKDQISVLLYEKAIAGGFTQAPETERAEPVRNGAVSRGVLGRAGEWLVEVGVLTRPDRGRFLAAGPLLTRLNRPPIGAEAAGFVGELVRAGIPALQAERYEGRLVDGKILISIQSENPEETARVESVLKRAGADDIAIGTENSVHEAYRGAAQYPDAA